MAARPRGVAGRGRAGRPVLSRPLRRGVCYVARGQHAGTIGLLVVSNDLANRATREVTACPVFRTPPAGAPAVAIAAGWVAIGSLIPRSQASMDAEVFEAEDGDLAAVDRELADLLLIPDLTTGLAYSPTGTPAGTYPRWGTTYSAEPPLGGENKRWLVVSHDHFNAGTGDAVCVRTTSNTSYAGPEVPFIEGGSAVAVAPDVQTKAHRRFDVASAARLPQPSSDERRKVAIALANYLHLQRYVGRPPR